MKLLNLTPHAINLRMGGQETVLPSEGVARVDSSDELAPIAGFDVPVYAVKYGDVTGLPEPAADTYFIVSAMVLSALPERTDLLAPHKLVRDEQGRIIACEGFRR